MKYGKYLTRLVVQYWALGYSAQETVAALKTDCKLEVGVATVYRRRHSLTAQEMVDELIRKQLQDIKNAKNPAVRMKYRDRLLAKMIPQRIEKQVTEKVDVNVTKTEELLKQYELIILQKTVDVASVQKNRAGKQVHTAQASNNQ